MSNLKSFLEKRLPELGLDAETYGPYIIGDGGGDDDDDIGGGDDGGSSMMKDEDELREVMELLQASSETHADADQSVWDEFLKDVLSNVQKDSQRRQQAQKEEMVAKTKHLEEQLARAKLELVEAAAVAASSEANSKKQSSSSAMDDAEKRKLIQQYGYEMPDDDDDDDGPPVSNHDAALAHSLDKTNQIRSHQQQTVATKKDEQQKTKEQRLSKDKAKEERRKRATKGERKR